ncbi:MAG TPA: FKBP-type peptidyl-prolyl cis-trans isomerase [Rhodocyclaceae bacterium]|nr:FKBP-type peptidyl-prolyl cis-trans isomerase [Rhodocyclaceae bacterium]
MSDIVQADSLITLHYRVATTDGAELVGTYGSTPATLQLGNGELAPPLEQCIIGKRTGEHHEFTLEAERAFGAHNPQLMQRIPRAQIPASISPAEPELHGAIEFSAPSGQKFTGVVRDLNEESIVIDFNHPLAGKAVRFEVDIVGIL